MKKRMLSAILAMSMVMGMSSVTAFAADETVVTKEFNDLASAATQNFTATGKADLPTINVTVPTTGAVVLDPFNISQNGQIASADFKIINNSNIPLTVTIKDAKAVTNDTAKFSIVPKAATDSSKWAVVNINVTDGIGKSTKKVLSGDVQDLAVATAMAPKGGIVKYNYEGTTAVDPENAWTAADTLTVSNTFSFAMNSYAVYNVAKAITCSMSEVNYDLYTDVDEDGDSTIPDEATLVATFPATVIGDSKIEIPVKWEFVKVTDGAQAYAPGTAGTYTFKAVVADADIYKIGGTATMPTITVTIADTTPTQG